ncbi:hypothetical protein Tco_0102852 [Tanacetum coccineum]
MQLTELMVLCTKLQTHVLDLQKAKDAQAKEIDALNKRIQRLERRNMSRPTGLKRLSKVGMSRRVKSSEDQESLGVPEDASKQGRSIEDIDVDVSLVDETQERQDDDLIFDSEVLEVDVMHVEAKVDGKDEQSKKPDDSTAGEAVTTASIDDSADPSEFKVPQEIKPSSSKDKGKGIMIEPEVLGREKIKLLLMNKLQEIFKLTMIEVDRLLAERLQSKEREELTDEEKAKLFMELMEKRRKHFAALRAQEKRNRPPTKAHKRTQMSTYLKHMGRYTYKQLKGKSFDEIQNLFDKKMKRVNTFVAMGSEVQESKEKKEEGKEQQKESSKKQKVEEEKESEEVKEDDEVELKKLLVIKKDKDIAIDAIPLATKLLVIIDYKLHKEGLLVHYELIRADGSSKRYSSMIRMLQGIDREDLEALWRIVKAKHGDTRPENEFERVLYGDLKVMFEPDIKSDIWRMLQGYKVTIWKLIDSFGVHFVRRNLKIQKMNIKFRGGLLGLKRLHGFLEVTAAQVRNRSRFGINKSEHSKDSQLMSDEEEKKDNDGDADDDDEDEDDDHISDIQDTDDEDEETESDNDEIYMYKIQVHKDVDVEMVGAETVEHENKEEDEMTDAAKSDVELARNAMTSDYQVKVSIELPLPSSSLSVSSGFGTHFLNLSSDISLTGVLKDFAKAKIISLMDVHIQQETSHIQSPSILKVPVSVIPKTTTLPPIPEIPTETSVSTALSPLHVTPTILIVQKTTTPIPTPPITTEAPTITTVVPESVALAAVQLRVAKLENDVFKLKKIDHFAESLASLKSQVPTVVEHYLGSKIGDDLQKVLQRHIADLIQKYSVKPTPEPSKIQKPTIDLVPESEKSALEICKIKKEQAEKQKMAKYTIKSTDKVALKEYDLKSALYQTMNEKKSFNRNLANHALYHALMEALIEDENAMDKGITDTVKNHKRKHDDDKDDNEDPSTRPN